MERDASDGVEDAGKSVLMFERAGGNDEWLEFVDALLVVEMSLESVGGKLCGLIDCWCWSSGLTGEEWEQWLAV